MSFPDTIAALATPSGRGGIAVVRVSGPLITAIMQEVLGGLLTPRQACHLPFKNTDGSLLDEGVAIYFPQPNSFTGEDVLELHAHGSPVVIDLILQRLVSLGARLAGPGEFSQRAFLNDKMDLTQAEAIADLINASSKQAAVSALRSLQGEFANIIFTLNEKIIHLRTYIEAAIDFSDEEIDFLSDAKISLQLQYILAELKTVQDKATQGSFLRDGITAVIIGPPNVGKSTLLNVLAEKDIAIVTDIPGTTRDVIRDSILVDDLPIHILDTAGLRDTDDPVEQEGIRRTRAEIAKADIILHLSESENFFTDGEIIEGSKTIFIRNKIDLNNESPSVKKVDKTIVALSAKMNLGIDLLKQEIKSLVGFQNNAEGIFIARRRHLHALKQSEIYLQNALEQLKEKQGELVAEDLRLAHLALCEITGEFSSDDLLGRIFSSFCVGK